VFSYKKGEIKRCWNFCFTSLHCNSRHDWNSSCNFGQLSKLYILWIIL